MNAMTNASIHSNAKHILRRPRVRARIEELRRQEAQSESPICFASPTRAYCCCLGVGRVVRVKVASPGRALVGRSVLPPGAQRCDCGRARPETTRHSWADKTTSVNPVAASISVPRLRYCVMRLA
jgi:hypothetical protein